ncbi:MAG: hypothetical protein ACKVP7_11195 [Hyphomicrobiaceae bacterium]
MTRAIQSHQSEGEIAQAAAERAACSLQSGTATVRSGILDEEMLALQAAATDILIEAQASYQEWTSAIVVSELIQSDPDYAKGLDHCDTANLLVVHRALLKSGLLGAYRLTDDPKDDRTTLCMMAGKIGVRHAGGKIHALLYSEDWLRTLGFSESVVTKECERNRTNLEKFTAIVPTRWAKHDGSGELAQLRRKIKPLRDNALAHHIPRQLHDLPTYQAAGRLVDLTLGLATMLAGILKGRSSSAEDFKEAARVDAERYWKAMLTGPRDKFRQHRQLIVGRSSKS